MLQKLALMLQEGFLGFWSENRGITGGDGQFTLFTMSRNYFKTWLCKTIINNRFCMANLMPF